MDKTTSCLVYWLYDNHCVCPWRHGYVGISANWSRRLKRHRSNRGAFQWKHLFVGSIDDCLNLERRLRPQPGIGWNEAPGGEYGGGSAPKKQKTRELMRKSALLRYTDPAERERTALIVREALKEIDRSGPANSNYGKTTSEATKKKMRLKIQERGGVAGPNNPIFGKPRPDHVKNAIRLKLQKTECHRGHPKEPGKQCSICGMDAVRRYRARRRTIASQAD
jgi:hypothetical protein